MVKIIGVTMIENELDLIEQLESIAGELGGRIQRLTTYDSKGTTSKKVVIEYDIQDKPT